MWVWVGGLWVGGWVGWVGGCIYVCMYVLIYAFMYVCMFIICGGVGLSSCHAIHALAAYLEITPLGISVPFFSFFSPFAAC